MKRMIDHALAAWRADASRKALLVRGARQVGKTFAVREFAKSFENLVEINFEKQPALGTLFEPDLDPRRILRDVQLATGARVDPGKTLFFLDEIQAAPRALTALRYFQEDLPALHVVAAGSLVEFAVAEVGIPVGRVASLFMHPMSFLEFLAAKGRGGAVAELVAHSAEVPLAPAVHAELLRLVGEYLAVGGMPEAVAEWVRQGDLKKCLRVQRRLADTYRQDFAKYSRLSQVKYVDLVFSEVPRFLGRKFVFARLAGSRRRRDLQPAVDLLAKAGLVTPVVQTAANGLPLGAQADPNRFKLLFLDIGLAESILGFDGSTWILDPENAFVNAGELAEAFVGQELLAYASPHVSPTLHYWHREAAASNAEVDYLMAAGPEIVPIEVKRGAGGALKSMRLFLETHRKHSRHGVRFSTHNYSTVADLKSYPLYGVASFVAAADPESRAAMLLLADSR
jgi:predicted AAA+ superfamily ATPase